VKLLARASGYAVTPWKNDRQEIACTLDKRCLAGLEPALLPFTKGYEWAPSNKDFEAVGVTSGGSSPVASVDDLLKVISQQSVESIEELRILAHGNADYLALAGTVLKDDVDFNVDEALIGVTSDLDSAVAFRQAIPRFHDLQDRFTADGKVVLMACHSGGGTSPALLSAVSHAFLRKVAGFRQEISMDFEWGPTGKDVKDGKGMVICQTMSRLSHITRRGKLLYGSQSRYITDAFSLDPDLTANDGDVFAMVRDNKPDGLAWRILAEFFPTHPWISGSEILQQSKHVGMIGWMMQEETSLAVRKHDGGMFIAVSPYYAQRTTPRTLANRVAEMGKAIELVAKKAEGSIRFQ
jgi:hypothetical protein